MQQTQNSARPTRGKKSPKSGASQTFEIQPRSITPVKKKETNSGNQDTSELKNEIDKALTTSKSKRKRNPKSSNPEIESIDLMEYRALGGSLKTVSVAEVLENMEHPECKLDDLC